MGRSEVDRFRITEFPRLWRAVQSADVGSDMTESNEPGAMTATVHIFPRGQGWRVVRSKAGAAESTTHRDLGNALDDATSGPVLVHVVVHPREVACDAA